MLINILTIVITGVFILVGLLGFRSLGKDYQRIKESETKC